MTVTVLMSLDCFSVLFICCAMRIIGFTFSFFLLQIWQHVKWCITLGRIGNKICHALNLISHHVNGINQMSFEFREYIILFKFTSLLFKFIGNF